MMMIILYCARMTDSSTESGGIVADSPKDVRAAELDQMDRRILSLLHGDARITNHALAELERTLSEYRIAWTIFPSSHPIVPVMDEMPGWRRLVNADGIVIHAREDQLLR